MDIIVYLCVTSYIRTGKINLPFVLLEFNFLVW